MNFTLLDSNSVEHKKLMMKKHLEHINKKTSLHQTKNPSTTTFENSSAYILNSSNISAAQQKNLPQLQPIRKSNSVRKSFGPYESLGEENSKMKKYYRDQIEEGMRNLQKKKKQDRQTYLKEGKIMATQNGTLDYLQRQMQKRNTFIKNCLNRQQKANRHFIDEDKLKESRVFNHINLNYDADVFNHESDRYQHIQKVNEHRVFNTNSHLMHTQKADRDTEKNNYRRYLDEKYSKKTHDPITNPMEYHIDNPYLKACISKY